MLNSTFSYVSETRLMVKFTRR